MSTIITHRQFPGYHKYEMELAGRPLTLEVGKLADINIIDLAQLKILPPHIVRDLPAGGKRFLQGAEGYRYTLKSGQITYRDGHSTDALPGRLVRRHQA